MLQGPAEFDDIATYVETYGDELSEHEVLWTTAVANLASAPLWCAVAGQYRFAADGERTVAMPTITVGDLVCAAPWFSARLARSGPIVSMTTVLGTNHVLPVRVELDVGTHEPVGSLGAALLGLSLGELQLSPFARGSLDTDDELGIAAGIEAAMQLGGGCGAGLELSWRHDDLRSEFDGCFDGVAFRIWVEFAL